MATIYHKTVTKPLPDGAEIIERKGERCARWKDTKGRTQTAPLTIATSGKHAGETRILVKSKTYTAKYRDGAGLVVTRSTGCRDETAARQVLANLVRRAELVKAEVMTAAEHSAANYQTIPPAEHFTAYLQKLESEDTTAGHRANVERCLNRLAADGGWQRLVDVTRESFERWLTQRSRAGMGARTRNLHRSSIVAFCNWCVQTSRMAANPLASVAKADEKADRRRQRRAMTDCELTKLLRVARCRPLAEYGRETVKKPADTTKGRRTWSKAPLTFDALDGAMARARDSLRDNATFVEQLESIGRERALIYKTLVLTGLRRGELASITAGQMELDEPIGFITLHAADEKNREGSDVPLRSDLADDLRSWLADKLLAKQNECRRRGEPIPSKLPADAALFRVPRDLFKILNRDLQAAGIPKRDERGRTIDVHALRHSFGTLLSKAGVAPRTAQAAMRHSSIDLTMNTYTDPKLLDVHGALDGLPALSLNSQVDTPQQMRATGTDEAISKRAPKRAPTSDKTSKSGATADKIDRAAIDDEDDESNVVSLADVKRKQPVTSSVTDCSQERVRGLEPPTYSLGSCHSAN